MESLTKKQVELTRTLALGMMFFGSPAKCGPQQLGYQHGETDIPDGCVLRLSGGFFSDVNLAYNL